MERFVKGDVIVIKFPFSDLSNTKKRPALIITKPLGEDILLAQITSKLNTNNFSVSINKKDFEKEYLLVESVVKLNRLFSADQSIIEYKVGRLTNKKMKEIETRLIQLIKM